MNTVECGGAHEGKGEEWLDSLREYTKYKDEKGHESQFFEDLQTLLFGQLCLASLGVQNQNERPENEYNSSSLMMILPWNYTKTTYFIC